MFESISEDLKKVVLTGIGAVAVTYEKGKEVIEQLVKKGEITVEQGKALSEELKHHMKDAVKEAELKSKKPIDVSTLSQEELTELKRQIEKVEKEHEADGE